MSNAPLNIVTEHNYLGVHLHHWEPHVNYVCNKASQLLSFLKRKLAIYNTPIQIKKHLYTQLLLPSIEYCSSIWDSHHLTAIQKLEMIDIVQPDLF